MSMDSDVREAAHRDDYDLDDEMLEGEGIDRTDTGLRIVFTLLFFVITRLVEGVLTVLIVFELLFALVTQREPSKAVKRFAHQTLSYLVRVGRYITYNDPVAPFPFREFEEELDLTTIRS